ncbi:MAG: chemotaxis protein CheD [Pseudomonadota bacterium]
MTDQIVNVRIGQVKTGSNKETLSALLGSCVGIALLWPDRESYSLAHCLLSHSPTQSFEIGGKYVDQAVHSMIQLMKATPADYSKIKAVVAGGGNMTKAGDCSKEELVGHHNSQAAIEVLNEWSIDIIYKDVGGVNGRKIRVFSANNGFEVQKIPRSDAA